MCGIYGIWQLNHAPVNLSDVQQATTLLRHRGPDDEGYLLVNTQSGQTVSCGGKETAAELGLPFVEQHFGQPFDLALGFRRLAILDLSPAGHQPMPSADGRYWLIYNGEIYNYIELRAELMQCGHSFRSGSDTEVILAAYQQWGATCLSRFNGMWAFALWDSHERQLFLTRDRFGIKPLYFHYTEDTFVFASEIKALVGRHGLPFAPDGAAIYRYLTGNLLPGGQTGRTFFNNIQSLSPGHWMTIQPEGMTRQRFWSLPHSQPASQASPDALVEEYRYLFSDAVRLRLRSDVAVGTSLSGGLDSSAIVCTINRLISDEGLSGDQIGRRQKTFSAIYETEGRYNEASHIRQVLDISSAEGIFTYPSANRLRQELDDLIWHQEEPFGTTSPFAQWCVMKAVRGRDVTVLLDGQGADEALAGYQPLGQFLGDLLRAGQIRQALAEAQAVQATTGASAATSLLKGLACQLPSNWIDRLRRRQLQEQADLAILSADFRQQFEPLGLVDEKFPWSAHQTLDDHLRHLLLETRLPHLLRHEDRNSMAFSIEARVPFLDVRLVEFTFTQAANLRIREGWTKWILRRAMNGRLPDSIVWRRDKVGFETPQNDWLQQLIRSGLEFAHIDPYINPNIATAQANTWLNINGSSDHLWRWINLETWLRVWTAA